MAHEGGVQKREVKVWGATMNVFVGGDGPSLLLVHGGWMGAEAHWSRVWELLAKHYQVIAPDLPGLGDRRVPALASVREYAEWLAALLDALGVEKVRCVGNSFGASVAWSFAGRFPERCTGVGLVNGIPMPKTPAPLRLSGNTRLGRALMRAILRALSFTPRALPKAFFDPALAPSELRAALSEKEPPLLRPFADLLIAGDGAPEPRLAPLIIWGEQDQLPGTGVSTAKRLQASRQGAELTVIARAGHFPQMEAPEAFAQALAPERWRHLRAGVA